MIICISRCANFNYYDENVGNYVNSDFDEDALMKHKMKVR